jgi:hypothetical protein
MLTSDASKVADIVLTMDGGADLRGAMGNLFPGLPIALPPVHRSSTVRRDSGWWMKRVLVQDADSAHQQLKRLGLFRSGRLRFHMDAPVIPDRKTLCLTTPALHLMNVAWLLMEKTAVLVRLSGDSYVEAGLIVLSLRPLQRHDGGDNISVHVSDFNGSTLAFRVGDCRWNLAGHQGIVGVGRGLSLRKALKEAQASLEKPSEADLPDAAIEALGLWSASMEFTAAHVLRAWGDLPGTMTQDEYLSLPPHGASYDLWQRV